MDVASGKNDRIMPGVAVADYDISRDGRDVVFTTRDKIGEPEIWIAPLDRRSSPRRLMQSADQASFDSNGDVFFRVKEQQANYLYRMSRDGSDRERITSTPILIKYGVSPDGEWVAAAVPVPGNDQKSPDRESVPMATMAIPVHGGAFRRICGATCSSKWSADGRFFYVADEQMWVIPVPAGTSFPELPAAGIGANETADSVRGARVIDQGGTPAFGPDPAIYVFPRTALHANLFRIPLH